MSGLLAKCCCGTGSDCSSSSVTLPCTISRASWDTSISESVSASVRASREYQLPFPPSQNQDFVTVSNSIEASVSGLNAEEVDFTVDGSFDTSQANLPKWRAVISAGTSPAEILSSQINSSGATASFTYERPYIYNISNGQIHEWRLGKIVTQRASSVVPAGAAALNNNPVTGQSAIDIQKSYQGFDILTPNPPQGPSPATGCVTKFRSTLASTPTGILSYPVFESAVEVKTWYAEDGSVLDSETVSGSETYENQLDFEYVRLGNQQKCDSYLGLESERFAIVPSTGPNNWVLRSPYALYAVNEFNRACFFMSPGTDGVDLLQFLTGASFSMKGLPNEPLQLPLLRSQAVENVQWNGWDIEFLTLSHRVDIDTTTPAEYP